ncbi:nucleoside transporter C-terminal domain-containing protein [Thermoleptolyngbya sp. C42_A2020_037]|uniref:NupC/NupG family nucleoside CNT transporter n=1 Tax=Thermoleptolyngbya sp. C42_A2020_037 TaxID=2747799 RepID=UPI001A00AAF8|nr:nucleoside transporter C-terminal domain-containing protein [Thermoleptolyngbya sp. C42_A2020_037]MBF2084785.1 nucleoside:proton symporter [Thermoleptolyngbya sp. C42_A2020_037]
MSILNLISFVGIFGLCAVAWLFSENRDPKYFPWRVVIWGILLQLILGFLVFAFPITQLFLQWFTDLLNVIFDAADAGARFVFGNRLVPIPGQEPLVLSPLPASGTCAPAQPGEVLPGLCGIQLGYIFAFRALPAVIFFSGLMALLYNLGIIQVVTNFFARIFYRAMRLSGAESLSGAANIFVGIEAAIVVKPFLASMTRSELLAILACCFGTAASSTLAIYVSFLKPVFPNILGHLVSASVMAIPACFVLSKILLPETTVPVTAGGIPDERSLDQALNEEVEDFEAGVARTEPVHQETVAGEPIERVSPLDAAIVGALDGVKMAVAIAAVLILILGLVYLVNQFFGALANIPGPIGSVFQVITLQNILGALFLPLTVLTGVSLDWSELWASSVIIGRRLFETAIPPYQSLAAASRDGVLGDRALLIVSYALSGFAHLASVGIFVGGTTALIPSRRKDISELGWKALFVGTLATMMIACVAGVFDTGNPSILGTPDEPAPQTAPASPAAPSPAAPAQTIPAPLPASPSPTTP